MPKKIRSNFVKKRKDVEKDFKQKINMFDKLPDFCLTCEEPFDKTDIEQVSSWKVVVKSQEETVRLYCPSCFDTATQIVKDFEKRVKERMENVSGSANV
jgi:predicted RNA-binding Zn-ribbon protein involved in translation (DUF1610 family)